MFGSHAVSPGDLWEFTATYLVHSTLIFGVVWLLQLRAGARLREVLWKASLLVPLFTTSARLAWPEPSIAPTWHLPQLEAAELAQGSVIEEVIWSQPETEVATAQGEPLPAPSGPVPPQRSTSGWAWVLAAAVGFACLRVTVPLAALGRLLKRRRAVTSGPLHRELARVRDHAGLLRPVRLYTLEGLASPVASGTLRPAIYVPGRALTSPMELVTPLLSHEVAHHLRLDPLWNRITHGVVALLFFQPLHIIARRRIADCAELLADDLAVRWTNDGSALASCLAEVAGWVRGGSSVGVGVPMVRRRALGALRVRVERALDRPREISAALGVPAACLVAVASMALMPSLASGTPEPGPHPWPDVPMSPYAVEFRRIGAQVGALQFALEKAPETRRPDLTQRLRRVHVGADDIARQLSASPTNQ